MTKIIVTLIIWAALSGAAAAEFVLQLPLGAKETYSKIETELTPLVAIGPFGPDGLKTVRAPKSIRRSVWAFGGDQTISDVELEILTQLEKSDYTILLYCQTDECGGFDFRFAVDVVSEPNMRVDLRDFRFISARQNVLESPGYITFFISKSPVSIYVQMVEYAPVIELDPANEAMESVPQGVSDPQESGLSFVLEGLEFESGSAKLGSDPDDSIGQLAKILKQNKDISAFLVGHSDMSGALQGNISLSKKRANTVLRLLVKKYGIKRSRLSAHGVGFLSPRSTSETREGRAKNRRVEAVFSK